MMVVLRRLRISTRLVGAMTVLLLLLVGLVALGLSAMARQRVATDTLAEYRDTTQLAMQVKFRSADFNGYQTAYAFDISRGVEDATDDAADARAAFLTSAAAFRTDMAALERGRLTTAERALIKRAMQRFEDFMDLDATIITAYRAGTPEADARADRLVAVDEIAIFNDIAATIDALTTSIDREAGAAVTRAAAASDRSRQMMLTVGAGAVLIGAALAFLLIRSIIRPLSALNHRLAEIADGDGDLTQRIDDEGRDEVTQAAGGFNRFAERMQVLVAAVADGGRQVAAAADRLNAVSAELAGGSAQTSTQAAAVSSSAEEVSAIVSTMAASAEEMNASISEISRSAARATEIVEGGVRAADAASTTIDRLAASSGEIQSVVELITAIAQQTNLLALNATIEAARAGEIGKGFAVVAGEVKDLAQQTASATDDIARKVSAITAGSAEVSAAISRITEVVSEINDTQVAIASAIEEQTATTTEMSRNVGETAIGAGEIATTISGVAQAADRVSGGAQSTQATAQELVVASDKLTRLVAAFRY